MVHSLCRKRKLADIFIPYVDCTEKRTQAFEAIEHIPYKDHLTNEEVHREIQAAIGEYDELLTNGKLIRFVLKFSKDNPAGNR